MAKSSNSKKVVLIPGEGARGAALATAGSMIATVSLLKERGCRDVA